MNLTREETARIELGRTPGYFEVLNIDFPEENGTEFDVVDTKYQAIEDDIETAIHNSEEVTGIDAEGEPKPIVLFPDRKPPVTRPTFPF